MTQPAPIPEAPDANAVSALVTDLLAMAKLLRANKRNTEAGMVRDCIGMLQDVVTYWAYNVNNRVVPTLNKDIRALFDKHGLSILYCDINPRKFERSAR